MTSVKVNIGCGPQVAADWINYDSSLHVFLCKYRFIKKILYSMRLISKQVYELSWPSDLIKRIDLRNGLPLRNETVDFVYCSHFLEHLIQNDAKKLLKECHRVLKPGCWMRIAVPDLRVIASKYLERDIDFVLFNVSSKADLSNAFINSLNLSDNRPFLERFLFPGSLHHCMYDYDSLAKLLTNCGFSVIERRRYREGITPDIDLLDNRPEESVYVEARK